MLGRQPISKYRSSRTPKLASTLLVQKSTLRHHLIVMYSWCFFHRKCLSKNMPKAISYSFQYVSWPVTEKLFMRNENMMPYVFLPKIVTETILILHIPVCIWTKWWKTGIDIAITKKNWKPNRFHFRNPPKSLSRSRIFWHWNRRGFAGNRR